MDTQDILKSLSNLERTLQGVDSARQQVENTVAAYESARGQLSVLSQEFSNISNELNAIVSAITDNQERLNATLSERTEDVFENINKRIVLMGDTASEINKTFDMTCTKSAAVITGNVEAAVKLFCEKVRAEFAEISSAISDFRSIISTIEDEFKIDFLNVTSALGTSLENVTIEFKNQIESHLKAFTCLKNDLEAIVNLQKEYKAEVLDTIASEASSIKEVVTALEKCVKDMQASDEKHRIEIIGILSSFRQDNVQSTERMSLLFDKVASNLEAVQGQVLSVSSELAAVKTENSSIKKFVLFCLIAVIVSILYNTFTLLQ